MTSYCRKKPWSLFQNKNKHINILGSIHILVKLSNLVPFRLIHASQKMGTLQSLPLLPHLLTPQPTSARPTHIWQCFHQDQQGHSNCRIHSSLFSSCIPRLLWVRLTELTSFSFLTYFPPGSLMTNSPGSFYRTLFSNPFLHPFLHLLPPPSHPINQVRAINVHKTNHK